MAAKLDYGQKMVCGQHLDLSKKVQEDSPYPPLIAPEQGTLLPQHLHPGRRAWLCVLLCSPNGSKAEDEFLPNRMSLSVCGINKCILSDILNKKIITQKIITF